LGATLMRASAPAEPLVFDRHMVTTEGERHHRYEVEFHRGGVIECRSEQEARDMVDAHLARARKNRVEDHVVSAIWHCPVSRKRRKQQ
jgi:hypothetical protein